MAEWQNELICMITHLYLSVGTDRLDIMLSLNSTLNVSN